MAFRPQPITLEGDLHFPSAPQPPTARTLSGPVHAILRGTTLHLHRGNPLITRLGAEQDGAELARIRLQDKGWTAARRRVDRDDAAAQRWAVELWHETEEAPLSASPARTGSVLRKKRSTPGLHEATNSFSGKLAARMKRGKSISGAAAFLQDEPSHAEPLLVFASSRERANFWVESLNDVLSNDFVHISSGLTPSASLPVDLSSLSLGGPSSSSMTPSRHLANPSPFPLPPNFNSGRRPSWLDRPPPTNYRAPAAEASTSGRARSSLDVPAWIAATLAAHEQAKQQAEAKPVEKEEGPLRMRRSTSLLPAATTPIVSVPMGRSQSDGRRSMEGGGRRLLGLMPGRRSSKKGAEEHHLTQGPPLPSTSFYASRFGSKSSTSLAESSLSESHSTSNSSDRPSTPHEPTRPSTDDPPTTPRAKSPFSPDEQRTPRTFAETFTSRSTTPSSEPRTSLSHESRPTRRGTSEAHGRRKSRCPPAPEATAESTSLLTSRRRAGSGSGGLERIIDPLDLISMMRGDSKMTPSFPSTRLNSLAPPPPPSGLGGLSPPPRRSTSSRSLAVKDQLARPPERRTMIRQQSFGAVEGTGGEVGEASAST